MKRYTTLVGSLVLATTLIGCTTAQEIRRPGGETEYQIACGAAVGWNICYRRADEECPQGYETIYEKQDFNRKELKIACPNIWWIPK